MVSAAPSCPAARSMAFEAFPLLTKRRHQHACASPLRAFSQCCPGHESDAAQCACMLHRSAIAVAISPQYVMEVLGPRESVGAAAAAMEIAIAIDRLFRRATSSSQSRRETRARLACIDSFACAR